MEDSKCTEEKLAPRLYWERNVTGVRNTRLGQSTL